MSRQVLNHLRRQPVAFVALFFALGSGALAANKYILSTDTIPSGDLAGSTYGNPLIANGAVSNTKLANPALTITPGTGLTGGGSVALGSGTTIGADQTVLQHRLDSGCSTGNAIRSVSQDGTSTCQTVGFTTVQLVTAKNQDGDSYAVAYCPSGDTIVGGGGYATYGYLVGSYPEVAYHRWQVRSSAGEPAGNIGAEVLCAS
jgi:hypothetical protein